MDSLQEKQKYFFKAHIYRASPLYVIAKFLYSKMKQTHFFFLSSFKRSKSILFVLKQKVSKKFKSQDLPAGRQGCCSRTKNLWRARLLARALARS